MKCPVIYDNMTKIWSNPIEVLPPKMCLGQLILQKLDEEPNKIIEVNYDNGEKLISSELNTLAISAAQNLLKLGIKKGDVVLFFSEFNSLITPIVFACYIISAAICPIDLKLADDDADYIIDKVNPTVILYDPIYKSRVESTIKRINLLNLKYVLSFEPTDDGNSVPQMLFSPVELIHDFEAPDLGDPDVVIACLILTSGTTGRPKVVCLSHSRIFRVNWIIKTDSNSVIYVPTSFRWIVPVISMLFPISGKFTRVFSGLDPTPKLCLDVIKKYKVTNFIAVDGLLTKILQYARKHQRLDDLKTIQYFGTGGERISKVTSDLVRKLTPDCFFTIGYGMTELAGGVASAPPNDIESGYGYLIDGLSVKIIDNNKNSLGPNQNGQICIKDISPHLKYYKDDKLNAECFTTDDEWFLTGDYGKFDDKNFLHVLNRCADLIKCGKYVIIPSILEKILEGHEAIENSYIIGIPDSNKEEIPVAFIKFNSNISTDRKSQDDLKKDINIFLKSHLPSDQLPPEKIYFMDNFPYTSCGKVDKMKLKEWAKMSPAN